MIFFSKSCHFEVQIIFWKNKHAVYFQCILLINKFYKLSYHILYKFGKKLILLSKTRKKIAIFNLIFRIE